MSLELILSISLPFILAYIRSLEIRMKNMNDRLNNTYNKEEADQHMDLRLEVVKASQKDLKEDITEIKVKLDKLLDLHINKNCQ